MPEDRFSLPRPLPDKRLAGSDVGTCPICGRSMALRHNKLPVHNHNLRPGPGLQSRRCPGSAGPPIELGGIAALRAQEEKNRQYYLKNWSGRDLDDALRGVEAINAILDRAEAKHGRRLASGRTNMSDARLRRALVRLAHENPDGIREHLLPLLGKRAYDESTLPWWNFLTSKVAEYAGFMATRLGVAISRAGGRVKVNPGNVLGRVDFVLNDREGRISLAFSPSMKGGVPSGVALMKWAGGVTEKKFYFTVKLNESPEQATSRLLDDIRTYHEHPGEPDWPA